MQHLIQGKLLSMRNKIKQVAKKMHKEAEILFKFACTYAKPYIKHLKGYALSGVKKGIKSTSIKMVKKYNRIQDKRIKAIIWIAMIFMLWMLSSVFKFNYKSKEPDMQLQKVVVVDVPSSDENIYIEFGGAIDATNKIMLKAHLNAEVESILAHDGQSLQKGDPILLLNPRGKDSSLKSAQAALKAAETDYVAAKKLTQSKLASMTQLQNSKARYEAALANLEQAYNTLGHSVVKAPFDGFIDKIEPKVSDILSEGQNIGYFVDTSNVVAVTYIPSKYYDDIDISKLALITDGLNATEGEPKFKSRIADLFSRSYRSEIEIRGINPFKIGQIVRIKIARKIKNYAFEIPKNAININEDGRVIIKCINEKNEVYLMAADIVAEKESSFIITGPKHPFKLITLGSQFVQEGQLVSY